MGEYMVVVKDQECFLKEVAASEFSVPCSHSAPSWRVFIKRTFVHDKGRYLMAAESFTPSV